MRHREGRPTAFERVIVHAARRQLCCRPGCTTCGSSEFLADGLLLLTRGFAPGQRRWRELSQAARGQWSKQGQRFTALDQKLLVARARTASLTRIARACGEKEWLPYLGLFALMVHEHEESSGVLASAWRFQLQEMFAPFPTSRYESESGPLSREQIMSYHGLAVRSLGAQGT